MTKTLLLIERNDEGASLEFNTADKNDMLCIATALTSLLKDKPALQSLIVDMLEAYEHDEDFHDALDKSTLNIPDFNKILKN
jgi:hypothetical protein